MEWLTFLQQDICIEVLQTRNLKDQKLFTWVILFSFVPFASDRNFID